MATDVPLDATEFIAFDLETTGLYAARHKIVEIGAVRFRADGEVLDSFVQLVHPGEPIPPEVQSIHGITDTMVADASTIDEVLPQFFEFLGTENRILLAHNASFDAEFVAAATERLGLAAPPHTIIDSCRLARRRMRLYNYKLETIGRHLHLIDRESHRALDDAMLLKDVFRHLVHAPPPLESTAQLAQLASPMTFQQFAPRGTPIPSRLRGLDAVTERHEPIEIVYGGGSQPGARRVVTPRALVFARGRHYLVAYCHRDEIEKTFRIDRIRSFRLATRDNA